MRPSLPARYRRRPVRLVEPAANVELRADRHGHAHVVFAFPYRADIVDAVRAIPGRRFDWDAKEWWAPQADATAPYVKGVIERHPALARRPTTCAPGSPRRRAAGSAACRRGAARRPRRVRARDDLRRAARGARRPRSAAAASGSRSRRPSPTRCSSCAARGWTSARCAARRAAGRPGAGARHARAGRQRRRAALHARRQLGPGHDPRLPRPARLRGARPLAPDRPVPRRAARALPAHVRRRRRAERRRRARAPAGRARRARSRTSAARAPTTRPPLAVEAVLGGELRPFQRAGVAYVAATRGARSSPTSRASARRSRRSPRSRRTTPTRPS